LAATTRRKAKPRKIALPSRRKAGAGKRIDALRLGFATQTQATKPH